MGADAEWSWCWDDRVPRDQHRFRLWPPCTVSLKSMLGHTMGADSGLAGAACALAIRDGFIPPTINHVETDPECAVDRVPNRAVPAHLDIVQSNGLAFAGNNAVVLFGGRREQDA